MHQRMAFIVLFLSILCIFPGASVASDSSSERSSSQTLMAEQAEVRASLDRLVEAYQGKQISRFMSYVAEDFTGDGSILESSLRDNASANHNVSIRYTVTHITVNENGKAAIGVNFTRNQAVIQTGKVVKSSGTTELVFKKEDGVYKLYSMARPFLFEMSE